MDRSKRPSLAAPAAAAAAKVEAAPKLRKKLQKMPKQRNLLAKRPTSGTASDEPSDTDNKFNAAYKPTLTLPPDLSDSKWSEYLGGHGYICPLDPSPRQSTDAHRPPPVAIVPEFAHLHSDNEMSRSSTETLASEPSPKATTPNLRRQAKTPILRIGQLEAQARARNASNSPSKLREMEKPDCAETMAEQYRALLGSEESLFKDSQLELAPAPVPPKETAGLGIRRGHTPEDLPRQPEEPRSATLEFVSRSPTSDDGTLVSFDDEAVYFKPVSFSQEPRLPSQFLEDPHGVTSPLSPNALPLQICVDLLSRDLGSAVNKRPRKSSQDESALHVWIMIEAYERLRDQVLNSGLDHDEVRSLHVMFDTWLKALYKVHDSLTGLGASANAKQYDELERAAARIQLN